MPLRLPTGRKVGLRTWRAGDLASDVRPGLRTRVPLGSARAFHCMGGESRVLMGDGSTRALADIRAGDEIYGTVLRGWSRRYLKQRVLAHWRVERPAWRITLQDGTQLVAGADHRFLTELGWKFVTDNADPLIGRRSHLTWGDRLMGFGAGAPHTAITMPARSDALLRVTAIERLRTLMLYDITTETEDFVANGVISHNCRVRR